MDGPIPRGLKTGGGTLKWDFIVYVVLCMHILPHAPMATQLMFENRPPELFLVGVLHTMKRFYMLFICIRFISKKTDTAF